MQIQALHGLSKKSRSILYRLKKKLEQQKQTLQNYICSVFQYQKEKFNHKQFEALIKFHDPNLIYDEIDTLFQQLDDCKNGFVFYYRLKEVYSSITQSDNLNNSKSTIVDKFLKVFQKEKKQQNIVQQVKSLFLESQDIFEIIDLFSTERDQYLTIQNVIQLLNNFDFKDQNKKEIFIKFVFENKKKVSIKRFIEKVGLQHAGLRLNMEKLQNKKQQDQINIEELHSQFVKSRLSESVRIQESLSIDLLKSQSNDGYQYIPIQKIPLEIQNYYNYGSELQANFANFASQYIKNEKIFIDPQNPIYTKAYQWIHLQQSLNGRYTLFQAAKSILIRDKNRKGLGMLLQPKDIVQGSLGDCYFLSAIAGIVQKYPQLVYRLFVLQKNPSHIYGIRLFIDGIWRTIVLDACFPISKNRTFCGAQLYKHQIWVMLLQKAWAKVFGSYDNIHSGFNQEGLTAMAGAPSIHTSSRDVGFIKKIQVELKKGSIITCASSADVQQMTDRQQDQLGIYSNHAYTLLNIYVGLPYKNGSVNLLKVRNPWGRKQWKGNWSYYSSLWTKQLKEITNYTINPNDGTFIMNYDDFLHYFDHVNICQMNLSNQNSYITIESDRNEFNIIHCKIKRKGDYFFTLYQQNGRKFKKSFNYQKSKSWMFLVKIQGDKRIAMGSKTTQFRDNTIQATLDQGQYYIIAKISWKYWQKHSYNLTSYGPQKIKFKQQKKNNPINQISNFISSMANFRKGKVSRYENFQIQKQIYFQATQGYGFLKITNFQNRILQTKINLDPCNGIYILPPYGLPITLEIFPQDCIIVKFLVDPNGYMYHYSQKYVLLR